MCLINVPCCACKRLFSYSNIIGVNGPKMGEGLKIILSSGIVDESKNMFTKNMESGELYRNFCSFG